MAGKSKKKATKATAKVTAKSKPSAKSKSSAKSTSGAKSTSSASSTAVRKSTKVATTTIGRRPEVKPILLSGGNPQIPKGDGDHPVQTYIAAMPDWKRDVGRRLDALIVRTVPGVRKAVRWNSPFYGVDGQGWFLAFHCFTRYVKVTFIRGMSLQPLPPVESKDPYARYFHIHEHDELDEARLAAWIEQAAALPGWDFGSELRPLPRSRTPDSAS